MGHIFIARKGVKLGDPVFQSAVYVINFSKALKPYHRDATWSSDLEKLILTAWRRHFQLQRPV